MADAWFNIGGVTSGGRVTVKNVSARRGVGIGQLSFYLEIIASSPAAATLQLQLGGSVDVASAPGGLCCAAAKRARSMTGRHGPVSFIILASTSATLRGLAV